MLSLCATCVAVHVCTFDPVFVLGLFPNRRRHTRLQGDWSSDVCSSDLEMKSPDLEVNVLVSMENVTERVVAALKNARSPEAEFAARRAAIANLERESQDKTGLRSDVVSLYHGGEYWLYRYKKYTDVRLVFAPEQQIAFLGGGYGTTHPPPHRPP